MKSPTIKFKSTVLDELSDLNISEREAKRYIRDAIRCAERIANLGLSRVDAVRNNRRRDEKDAWRDDSHLVTYFGDGSLTVNQIKDVRRRLNRAHRDCRTRA